jgi:hypothetical protein
MLSVPSRILLYFNQADSSKPPLPKSPPLKSKPNASSPNRLNSPISSSLKLAASVVSIIGNADVSGKETELIVEALAFQVRFFDGLVAVDFSPMVNINRIRNKEK